MKKVLFSVAVVSAFTFASCGGPDMCDCMDLFEEMTEAEDMEKWAEDHKSDIEACEKLGEEMSDEERADAIKECEGGEEEEEEGGEE